MCLLAHVPHQRFFRRQSQENLLSIISVEREKLETIPFLQDVIDTVRRNFSFSQQYVTSISQPLITHCTIKMNQVGAYQQKSLQLRKNMALLTERYVRERIHWLRTHSDHLGEQYTVWLFKWVDACACGWMHVHVRGACACTDASVVCSFLSCCV